MVQVSFHVEGEMSSLRTESPKGLNLTSRSGNVDCLSSCFLTASREEGLLCGCGESGAATLVNDSKVFDKRSYILQLYGSLAMLAPTVCLHSAHTPSSLLLFAKPHEQSARGEIQRDCECQETRGAVVWGMEM